MTKSEKERAEKLRTLVVLTNVRVENPKRLFIQVLLIE
jgi:hypothetical protein